MVIVIVEVVVDADDPSEFSAVLRVGGGSPRMCACVPSMHYFERTLSPLLHSVFCDTIFSTLLLQHLKMDLK